MPGKHEVCSRIREIGILPGIRVPSADDARFAVDEMLEAGLSIVELTMTVPGALSVISDLARSHPNLMVGAGTVLSVESARACIDAGAAFITSPGFDLEVVDFTLKHNTASIPGALTPSEIVAALKSGAHMVKIFPCAQIGGPSYIKALRAPFPDAPFIASGGVNQVTARDFIHAGATALGIRGELIPPAAIEARDRNWIRELAGRFLGIVERARAENSFLPV
jgi:2-dehydro-3-deoxyphosphogluconate aldolase / (4S)-4-hydroxy-2-oxoglutarate aldolase